MKLSVAFKHCLLSTTLGWSSPLCSWRFRCARGQLVGCVLVGQSFARLCSAEKNMGYAQREGMWMENHIKRKQTMENPSFIDGFHIDTFIFIYREREDIFSCHVWFPEGNRRRPRILGYLRISPNGFALVCGSKDLPILFPGESDDAGPYWLSYCSLEALLTHKLL